MRRVTIFIFAIIIIGCHNHENKKTVLTHSDSMYVFTNLDDTLKVYVRRWDSIKKAFVIGKQIIIEDEKDSSDLRYIDIFGRCLRVRSIKVDNVLQSFFNEINLKKPFKVNCGWLDSIERFELTKLPEKFIPKVFNQHSDRVMEIKIQTLNIDEDSIPEKILQFYFSESHLTAILDYENGNWYCKSEIEHFIHYDSPKLSFINQNCKIIKYDYESGWGTDYFSNSTRLYRFIDGKTYLCLEYSSSSGTCYKYNTIWESLDSKAIIDNSDTIKICFIYNLVTFKDHDITKSIDTYLLKNKEENILFKWNNTKKQYEVLKTSNKALIDNFDIDITVFSDIYKSKIDSIEKYGSVRQQRAFKE